MSLKAIRSVTRKYLLHRPGQLQRTLSAQRETGPGRIVLNGRHIERNVFASASVKDMEDDLDEYDKIDHLQDSRLPVTVRSVPTLQIRHFTHT
jgi:hypothetical protein